MSNPNSSVPDVTLGPNGFVAPAESDILTGLFADWNAALGGNLNQQLDTPQGQIISSETAIIGSKNDLLLKLFNGVDPAYADGRMQDGIARIYFITRNPAQPTVVTATLTGLVGTVIPFGSLAVATDNNIYASTGDATIPGAGSIDVEFACAVTGPIACPAHSLSRIYKAIPGWDSIDNATDGVQGTVVESREDFEIRRQQSVFLNSKGSPQAVLGAVLNVPNVLDAYVLDNDSGITSGAAFTGTIAGTGLTSSAESGTLAPGQTVRGVGVAQGTIITANTGTHTWTVNISQAVGPVAMTSALGGIQLPKNSIYVAAVGGADLDVATAIWTKKAPGCGYYAGNTTVTVYDQSPGYTPPYPAYPITFQRPTGVPIYFTVTLANNIYVPSNALALIQAAIIAIFTGQGTVPPAKIGATLFASAFYPAVIALGSWVAMHSITIGAAPTPTADSIAVGIDQVPTIVAAHIGLVLV